MPKDPFQNINPMKKTTLLALFCLLATMGMAQVEYLYDFNSLTEGSQNLNGQDGWVTHYPTWHQTRASPSGILMEAQA